MMEIKTCDARLRPRATHPRLARKPVRSALARAQRAIFENLARRLGPLSQQAASICFDIHRLAHTPNIVPNPSPGFHTRAARGARRDSFKLDDIVQRGDCEKFSYGGRNA